MVLSGSVLIQTSVQDAYVDQTPETGRQNIVGDTGGLEVVEMTCAEERIAHDEQRPPLADEVE